MLIFDKFPNKAIPRVMLFRFSAIKKAEPYSTIGSNHTTTLTQHKINLLCQERVIYVLTLFWSVKQ